MSGPSGNQVLASAILEAAAVPILVLDREFRFVYVNRAYTDTFGFSLSDLRGRRVFDVFPEDEARVAEVRTRMEQVLQGRNMRAEAQPWRISDENGDLHERFWRASETPLWGSDGEVTHIVQSVEEVTSEVKVRRQNEVIARELEHRLSNTLTMIGSLAVMTSRNAVSIDAFVNSFLERLHSVNRTLMLISGNHWQGLTLRQILDIELAQVASFGDARIHLDGPDFEFSVRTTKWTALLAHEMITNAVRYGCFSVPDGALSVTWRVEDSQLVVDWTETGRSGQGDPDSKGFGTVMLTLMPNMTSERTLTENGLHLHLRSPAGFISAGAEPSNLSLLS